MKYAQLMQLTQLMHIFCYLERLLVPMSHLEISFEKQNANYVLKSSETGKTFRYVFSNMRLLVPKLRINNNLQLMIERKLAASPCAYNYLNTIVREYIVPSGTSQWNRENCFCGDFLPGELCIVLVLYCIVLVLVLYCCKICQFIIFNDFL